jgi:hypothetical protein
MLPLMLPCDTGVRYCRVTSRFLISRLYGVPRRYSRRFTEGYGVPKVLFPSIRTSCRPRGCTELPFDPVSSSRLAWLHFATFPNGGFSFSPIPVPFFLRACLFFLRSIPHQLPATFFSGAVLTTLRFGILGWDSLEHGTGSYYLITPCHTTRHIKILVFLFHG